ncbi:unnamed protein product [Gongylonema pulchrum]|uniref:Calponin-homology (CH) domain-containing protein n=1 Tax=Gongylonema pulchrum TaxID=637853 RepID=A0A3P6QJ85_9BILA|nr:unnamed protein product [Gongylonema pulchrum]
MRFTVKCETNSNGTCLQAPNTKPSPTSADGASPTTLTKDDIPAVDADVKEVVEQSTTTAATAAAPTGQTNGEAKEESPETPRKDPREDPIGWINSLIPGAAHKANYKLLDWAQQLAVEDGDKRQTLPGKNDAVTKSQFLSFLRDGTLLAKLANRLQPGSVETVHEGEAAKEKANQTSNINAFINFAKEKAGLSEEQVRSSSIDPTETKVN